MRADQSRERLGVASLSRRRADFRYVADAFDGTNTATAAEPWLRPAATVHEPGFAAPKGDQRIVLSRAFEWGSRAPAGEWS
jgi:hypothetical protein